jgi:hypothetical protein
VTKKRKAEEQRSTGAEHTRQFVRAKKRGRRMTREDGGGELKVLKKHASVRR